MIDFYLRDKSLQAKDKIKECYEYYLKKDLTYDEIYEEYDKIKNLNPKLEFTIKNIFFKRDKLLRIKTNFMKEKLYNSYNDLRKNNVKQGLNFSIFHASYEYAFIGFLML